MSDQISKTPIGQGLLKVGKEGIMTGNEAVLRAYYARDYVIHMPDGDLDYDGLMKFFSAIREAWDDFTLTRAQIVVEGNLAGSRTIFEGVFARALKVTTVGTIRPTGKPVKLEVLNTFRFHDDGTLAEEWVQFDNLGYYEQLGISPSQLP